MSKNVLLIAYYYPPFGQTSSRRSGCMAKYLPCFGWNPSVLTRDWTPETGPYDPSITTEIPKSVKVHRIAFEEESVTFLERKILNRLFPHKDSLSFFSRAAQILKTIIEEDQIDIIWATCPGLINLTLASFASKETGVPWVADFRDVTQFVANWRAALLDPYRLFWEKRILKNTSAVVVVSDGFAKTLRERHQREVCVIPNGFDPDILQPETVFEFPRFEFVYTGSLVTGNQDFTLLLDTLNYLVENGRVGLQNIVVSFYGGGSEKQIARHLKHPLGSVVQPRGRIPRSDSLNRQRSALILLQGASPGTGWMTSKIYEYLIARRPILAIPRDEDSIEKLLKETGAGVACTTRDEMAGQLMKWYEEWEKTGTVAWHGNMQTIMQYSRKTQAGATARLFEKVLKGF